MTPFERLIVGFLEEIGEDPSREGLKETPRRVADAWKEMLSGMDTDPKEVLGTVFEESYDQIVALRNIEFYSVCEHHLLPFHGVAHVAYIPGLKVTGDTTRLVVGISKLARLVECFARRLQLQERLTNQVGKAMDEHLKTQGTCVVVEAQHQCLLCRGVKSNSQLVTSYMSGAFMTKPEARAEVMALVLRR